MTDRRYTAEHEWIAIDGGTGSVGISDYAQEQLGDVVFVELPEIGREVAKGDELAVVESVKAASEIYAPVDGTVTDVNQALADTPDLVNKDAEGAGWFVKLAVSSADQAAGLMTEQAYHDYVATLE